MNPAQRDPAFTPRVVLVTPGFPPDHGGVEEHTGRLAAEFVSTGLPVEVFTARRGLARPVVEVNGNLTVRAYRAWRTTAMSVSPQLLWAAFRSVRDADVLHVHSYHAMNALAVLARPRGAHVVFTPHYHGVGHSTAAKALHIVYRSLGKLIFRATDAVICVSEAEKELLIADFPFVGGRVRVIPNGVDTTSLRSALPFEDEPATVVALGRLEPYKGVAEVLRAFASLPCVTQLVIIGEGSQRTELELLAQTLGLAGQVRFLGYVPTGETHRWLRTARVLVSLSQHEAFGMVPLEAVGAGARVVLSDIAAHREITRDFLGDAAILVPAGDHGQLVAAIQTQLGRSDRVELNLPDWSEVALETLRAYQRAQPPSRTRRDSMTMVHPLRSLSAGRNAVGRRIGILDIPWEGHWTAIAAAPIRVPSVERLQALLLRLLVENPSAPLAGTISADKRRWVPVPAAEREDFVRRVIVAGDDLDLGKVSDYIEQHRPPLDSDLPLVMVGPQSICLYHSHMFGDASSFSQLVLKLIVEDYQGLVAMEPRAGVGIAVKALLRQPRSSYRQWGSHALRPFRRATTRTGPAGGVAEVPATEARAVFADAVLSNASVRELTRWRNDNCRGVSLTSVLTAAVYRALVDEGIPMDDTGYYSLFDVRRYTPKDKGTVFGNLAKSLFIEADMADPRSIGSAMESVLESGRAVPGMVIGAINTALRPTRAHAAVTAGPVTMSFVSMPTLPGLADLPWIGSGVRRYCGVGYPVGRLGISIFAIRLRSHMEVSATFDDSVLDSAAVRRAIGSLGDPALLRKLIT